MSLVENERAKLTANLLNAVASGIVITAVVAPVVAFYFGVTGSAQTSTLALILSEIIWIGIATALHLVARRSLQRLIP